MVQEGSKGEEVDMRAKWEGMGRRGILDMIQRLRLRRIVDMEGHGVGEIVGGIVM